MKPQTIYISEKEWRVVNKRLEYMEEALIASAMVRYYEDRLDTTREWAMPAEARETDKRLLSEELEKFSRAVGSLLTVEEEVTFRMHQEAEEAMRDYEG